MLGRTQVGRAAKGLLLLAGLLVGLSLAAGASAGTQPTVRIARTTIAVGSQGDVDITAENIAEPGLAAWTIDVVYDPSAVTPLGCGEASGSICNLDFTPEFIRIVGAKATGLVGDSQLASLTFRCDHPGASTLTMSLIEFHDATEADPMRISAQTVEGAAYCKAGTPPPLLGDVDCNRQVNSIDALLVLQYVARLITTLACIQNADINQDGRIDAIDAHLILLA
ncbi:MAG: dockerin type I domain-containing protein [Dehalococcoidia bacterium]